MTNKPFPEYKKQNHRQVNWSQKRPVHGFDTETFEGKAILICDEATYLEPESIEDVLEFLTRYKTRSSNNFFFNIKFDYAAIMKWLPDDLLTELILVSKLEYENYKIYYLQGKYLSITKHKHASEYYDLANFYHGTLDENMKNRLSMSKLTNIDVSRLNRDYQYYLDNRLGVIVYCLRDCEGAQGLGELLQQSYFDTIGIYPKKYISTANITGHFYRTKCYIPSSNKIMKETPEVMKYYWKAYAGGRFEVVRKGWFEGPVYDYDLKSAYPRTISELINPNMGPWEKNTSISNDAYYGVYKCNVSLDRMHLAPFGFKPRNKTNFLVNVDNKEIYLTKKEIFTYGKDADIDVVEGWEYFPKEIIKPFNKVVKDVFIAKEKAKEKHGKDSSEYDVVKKCLNTFYGLTVNVNEGISGSYWNPIYAAEITSECRMRVYQQAKAAGSSLISIETDGVWTDKKIPGIQLGKCLGEWDVDKYPWLYLIGSGQYATVKPNGKPLMKTRGIPRRRAPILDFAEKNPNDTKVAITRSKPVNMKEALIHNKTTIKDINVWQDFTNTISCNSSTERKWPRWDFTFVELRKDNFVSEPWSYDILYPKKRGMRK